MSSQVEVLMRYGPGLPTGVKSFAIRFVSCLWMGSKAMPRIVKELIPSARRVMDPFHVVRLAGDKLTACRQRLQREKYQRRGFSQDPLYKNRRAS